MSALPQHVPAALHASDHARDIVVMTSVAGAKVASHLVGEPFKSWRDLPYFTKRVINPALKQVGQPEAELHGLEHGMFVTDALLALNHHGYDVSSTDAWPLHNTLAAVPETSPLVRLTQDIAALAKFLDQGQLRSEHRQRYEAALEIRAKELADLQHYPHTDYHARDNALETAKATLGGGIQR